MRMQKRWATDRINNARIGHTLAVNGDKSVRCDHLKHTLFLHHMQDAITRTVRTNIAHITIYTAAVGRNHMQHITSSCRV